MLHFILPYCTCTNDLGEQTNLAKYQKPLDEFALEHPNTNIIEFFKQHNINRVCCRNTISGPWHDIFNDSTLPEYISHRSDPKNMPEQDLSHLKTNLSEVLEFPK